MSICNSCQWLLREEDFRMLLGVGVEVAHQKAHAVVDLCLLLGPGVVFGAIGHCKAHPRVGVFVSASVLRHGRAVTRSNSVETRSLYVGSGRTEGRHVRGLTSRPWAAAAKRVAANGRPTMTGVLFFNKEHDCRTIGYDCPTRNTIVGQSGTIVRQLYPRMFRVITTRESLSPR